MKILDVSAGPRGIWFDKKNALTTYIDIRPEMKPDLVMDSGHLPEEWNDAFDLVVFDPPHCNTGENSVMAKRYGHWTAAQIRDIVIRTGSASAKVTRSDGLMAFKWNTHGISLKTIMALLMPYWEPLFGHQVSGRKKHKSETFWIMLRRRDVPLSGNQLTIGVAN